MSTMFGLSAAWSEAAKMNRARKKRTRPPCLPALWKRGQNRTRAPRPAIALLKTTNEPVVFAVMPYPEPDDIVAVLHRSSPIVDTHSGRPHPSHLLEVQRWMPRVILEEAEVRVGKLLNLFRELLVEPPELRGRAVFYKSVLRPSRTSRMASSARASR